jgi:hypothetical protein
MCLACQMEDELWAAYLEHVAQQEKAPAADAAPAVPASTTKAPPASPFVCEEQSGE